MSSPAFLPEIDREQRETAIDPSRSFLVQAPAGSGKTELLIQRYLRLLGSVNRPEAIVAVTFTRKAAGEMLDRILDALRDARAGREPSELHRRRTAALAAAALERDRELAWNLLDHPGRLRVQTIDSLCASITGSMPWMARMGEVPGMEENAEALYAEAARRTVLLVEDPEHRAPLETLLLHLDNQAERLAQLLAELLASRDQWIELAVQSEEQDRSRLEESLRRIVEAELAVVDRLVPLELRYLWVKLARYAAANLDGNGSPVCACLNLLEWPAADADQLPVWVGLATLVRGDDWRKTLNKRHGFPKEDPQKKSQVGLLVSDLQKIGGLGDGLDKLSHLPPPQYTNTQWQVMTALLQVLKLAVGQLRVVFRQRRVVDFVEVSMSALYALGTEDSPTDLAFLLDSRIEHLLMDEFQDTSRTQFELVRRLVSEWQPGEGRTLFLVGDPMQSIYRFRQAEVGLFLEVRDRGILGVPVEPLQLRANYRSAGNLVAWVNQKFAGVFPKRENASLGAIQYSSSEGMHTGNRETQVTIDGFAENENQAEADRVVELAREALVRYPGETVGVLVQARTHLPVIVEKLKQANLTFRAVDIDPLAARPIVTDLLALTRAMLHAGDRVSWLAILRAPWCGLRLADLETIAKGSEGRTVWEVLGDPEIRAKLSLDGSERMLRLRDLLQEAFGERGRWTLRQWVERIWLRLGGPACLESEAALQDAADYLDLLESEQAGCDLADLDAFRDSVNRLFAKPDRAGDERLQIMTIHKAKGLEFDTVIVPGLGRPEKRDDSRLFLFHEWPGEDGRTERLLAPLKETGTEDDPVYRYLRSLDEKKNGYERERLLYVAVTRAKKRLHLLGQAKTDKNGEPHPLSRSMLKALWNVLDEDERDRFRGNQTLETEQPLGPSLLRRIPADWNLPALPEKILWNGGGREAPQELERPTFEWVGEALRIAGTVVHGYLQMAEAGSWQLPSRAEISRVLQHRGLGQEELGPTADRVLQALSRVQSSTRAKWILASRPDARSEYAIAGVIDGDIVHGKVDRTFVDENGVRWIVDFKTSAHQGGDLSGFLDEQQRRYADQMERYARLLAPLGAPVLLGLYFPLLDEWREWEPEVLRSRKPQQLGFLFPS